MCRWGESGRSTGVRRPGELVSAIGVIRKLASSEVRLTPARQAHDCSYPIRTLAAMQHTPHQTGVGQARFRVSRNNSVEVVHGNGQYIKPDFVKGEGRGNPMRFDLADLSLFRHVVDAGSITRGAERAHLALAAASTRIRNMEDVLGVPLLTRGRQGVTPTQAGRTLLQHARTILRQAERLHEDLGAYGGGFAGQIRVLSNTNALTAILPAALSSFLAAHSSVSVDLEERLSDEIVGLIAEGVADLGVVAGTVDAGALETYPFRRDRFVLVVGQDHPFSKRAKIGFEDVLEHDFVGLDRASAIQRFLATKAVRIGRPLRLREIGRAHV